MKLSTMILGIGAAVLVAGGGFLGEQALTAGSSPAAPGILAGRAAAVSGSGLAPNVKVTVRPQPRPTKAAPVAMWIDGCDHDYADMGGNVNVCVPLKAPPGQTLNCAYLKRVGIHKLLVIGKDPKNLAGTGKGRKGDVVCPAN